MDFGNMKIKDFIDYIIKFKNIDEILNECKTSSIKGFIFERIADIILKFGFCNNFPNSKYNHLIGNFNNGKYKILKTYKNYLNEKVISGNSSGCCDIALQNTENEKFIFISCKYYENPEKINNYDII